MTDVALTLETLEQLVSFDTVSANPNAQIIGYIEAFLNARGARCIPLPAKAAGKSGLYAEIGPQGAGVRRQIKLDVRAA